MDFNTFFTLFHLVSAYVPSNLEEYDFRNSEIDAEKMQTKFILSAGTLVVDGDFLSWPDTPLTIDNCGNHPRRYKWSRV